MGGVLWNFCYDSVKKIEFIDGKLLTINPDSYLILQSGVLTDLRPEINFANNQKLVFWQLHPNNYRLNSIFKIPFLDRKINKLRKKEIINIINTIEICDEKEAILFMDSATYEGTSNEYNISLKKRFLPITLNPNRDYQTYSCQTDTNRINISYIGRIEGFKYYPLIKLLDTLNIISSEYEIEISFFLIGYGKKTSQVLNYAKSLRIKTTYLGKINNDQILNVLIKNNINLNCAMGTSALDSTMIGIPTIVMNFFYKPFKGFPNYEWIYNQEDFSLGRELFKKDFSEKNYYKFTSLIKEFKKNEKLIVNKTIRYFHDNFETNKVADKFIDYVKKSNLIYSDIKSFNQKTLIRKIYNYFKYKKLI